MRSWERGFPDEYEPRWSGPIRALQKKPGMLREGRGYTRKTIESGQEPYITASRSTIAQAARSRGTLCRSKGLRGAFGLLMEMITRRNESLPSVACVERGG